MNSVRRKRRAPHQLDGIAPGRGDAGVAIPLPDEVEERVATLVAN